jgi:F0F1-type ATP synthase assembly protein I
MTYTHEELSKLATELDNEIVLRQKLAKEQDEKQKQYDKNMKVALDLINYWRDKYFSVVRI